MKIIYLLMGLLLRFTVALAQNPAMVPVTVLPHELKENSGLLNLNGILLTHNDSEGDASLFEINPETGAITRTVVVTNAENTDWEDLAQDQDYLYIGDIGNNTGSRTDLRIYRILKSAFNNSSNQVTADVISFSYPDQENFEPSTIHNFDAEALIAVGDSLYIFTKNWGNRQTTLYALPKTPGTYLAKRGGTFDTKGLVTGGTYHAAKAEIMLIGYTPLQSFAYRISNFTGHHISQGTIERFELNPGLSTQIEGICPSNDNGYYISSEGNLANEPMLYHLSFGITTSTEAAQNPDLLTIFPNPTAEWLHITHSKPVLTEIYDLAGRKQLSSREPRLHLLHLKRGLYLVSVTEENGTQLTSQKLVLK